MLILKVTSIRSNILSETGMGDGNKGERVLVRGVNTIKVVRGSNCWELVEQEGNSYPYSNAPSSPHHKLPPALATKPLQPHS